MLTIMFCFLGLLVDVRFLSKDKEIEFWWAIQGCYSLALTFSCCGYILTPPPILRWSQILQNHSGMVPEWSIINKDWYQRNRQIISKSHRDGNQLVAKTFFLWNNATIDWMWSQNCPELVPKWSLNDAHMVEKNQKQWFRILITDWLMAQGS